MMQVFEAWIESNTDVVRPATDKEQAQRVVDEQKAEELLAKIVAKEEARLSAIAKFRVLGLTDEEIAALVGVSVSDIESQ